MVCDSLQKVNSARGCFYATFEMCCNISSGPQLMKTMWLNENQELGGISYLELLFSLQVWKKTTSTQDPFAGIPFSYSGEICGDLYKEAGWSYCYVHIRITFARHMQLFPSIVLEVVVEPFKRYVGISMMCLT